MDDRRFDELTRVFGRGASRRSVLRGLAGTAAAGVAGLLGAKRIAAQVGEIGGPCQPGTGNPQQQCVNGLFCVDDNIPGESSGRCCPSADQIFTDACVCPEGTALCGSACISEDACCEDADCDTANCEVCDDEGACAPGCPAGTECDGDGTCVTTTTTTTPPPTTTTTTTPPPGATTTTAPTTTAAPGATTAAPAVTLPSTGAGIADEDGPNLGPALAALGAAAVVGRSVVRRIQSNESE